eukprot:scaffold1017_cov363-Pavlova_lutheri.AAC.3
MPVLRLRAIGDGQHGKEQDGGATVAPSKRPCLAPSSRCACAHRHAGHRSSFYHLRLPFGSWILPIKVPVQRTLKPGQPRR